MSTKPLFFSLVALAALFFAYVIIQTGLISTGSIKQDANEWMMNIATIISGVLATNLGAVLGFTVVPPQPVPGVQKFHPKAMGFRSSVSGKDETSATAAQRLQIIAAYFYVASLVMAAVFFFIAKDSETLVPFIFNLTNTLAGVAIGALTVSLGK